MAKANRISQEDFTSWKDNTITQAVFSHLQEVASQVDERWLSLPNGEVPPDPHPIIPPPGIISPLLIGPR